MLSIKGTIKICVTITVLFLLCGSGIFAGKAFADESDDGRYGIYIWARTEPEDDSEDIVTVTHYSANHKYEGEVQKVPVNNEEGFHGGGDYRLTMDFIEALENKGTELRSSIDRSIESHLMAYAAEQARVNDEIIHMEDIR